MKCIRETALCGAAANPSPFPYADYVQAKEMLVKALHGPRFYALLTGPSGMGKTCLLRDIAAGLDRFRHHVVYLSSSRASVPGIVHLLAKRLHLSPRRNYLETVRVLAETIGAQSTHLLLWLDEADQLDAVTLKELRMLAEAELGSVQLLSVVLSGLPALVAQLDAPSLFPLKRRLALRCVLAGLRRHELEPFLVHRFGAADAERVPLSVLDDLFERTQATPAVIDRVVRHALGRHQGLLDEDQVRAILDTAGL